MPKDLAPLVLECRRLALSHVPRAIEALVGLLDHEDPGVRSAAATAIMDRGYLRPASIEPERIEVTAVPVDVDELREQLYARVAALAATATIEVAPALPAPTPEEGTETRAHLPPRQVEPQDTGTSASLQVRGAPRGAFEGPPEAPGTDR